MMDFQVAARYTVSLCSLLVLAGCANPYALNINKLNYSAEQKIGVIQFTDPKLFPREHLIDERRDEIAFLDLELEKCNKITSITPSVIRELEEVRALSAGLGLSVDPAKAFDFNASKDLAVLKNDIAQTSLQMQLQQLKRDAELLKDQLNKQQSVVNQQSPSVPAGPTTVGTNVPSIPTKTEIEALVAKVDAILKAIQTDARSNIAALTQKGGAADPIDTFNYRRACRETVKSAINKTRLDSLHDFEGNALMRLQLQATAFPPGEGYDDTIGILRMEVSKPSFDAADGKLAAKVYRNWLDYVNRNINQLPPHADNLKTLKRQRIRTSLQFLSLSDYFDLAYLELPKRNAAGVGISGGRSCSGLQQIEKNTSACWYLRVALPRGTTAELDVQLQAPSALIDQLLGAADGIRKTDADFNILDSDASDKQCSIATMNDRHVFPRKGKTARGGKTAKEAAYLAYQVKKVSSTFAFLSVVLREELERQPSTWADIISQTLDFAKNASLVVAADEVLAALRAKYPQCLLSVPAQSPPLVFVEAIKQYPQRVAVYEVAPTERVQAVSTAARAADAVALAASIAGTLPTYGLGASGNIGFSRSAVGKADALELAPIVVGFAEPSIINKDQEMLSSFGWLLGPKAILDPEKQELKFVQPLKPYDLYADLSLPGWWPEFNITAYSAWAPNWRDPKGMGRTLDISQQKTLVRTMKVPMRNNFSDMEGLNTLLRKAANQPVLDAPRIAYIEPNEVSPCDGVIDFQIWGDNVWRTNMVYIGGKLIDGQISNGDGNTISAIRLLPDMHGIVVTLKVSDLPMRRGDGVELAVWTPDGHDTKKVKFRKQLQKDGKCL